MPPYDIGMDGKVTTLEAATDAAEWHAALVDVFETGLLSDRNPFGRLSLQSLTTVKIRTGAVVPWSGTTSNIPSGWLLCDGAICRTAGVSRPLRPPWHDARPIAGRRFQTPRPAAQGGHRVGRGQAREVARPREPHRSDGW